MRRAVIFPLLALLASMLVLAGCSESDDPAAEVRAVAQQFADLDPAICQKFTTKGLEIFENDTALCERGMKAVQREGKVPVRTIKQVVVTGGTATAIMATGDGRDRLLFREHDDAWKLDYLVALKDYEPPPRIRHGLSPTATASAYLESIRTGDRAAFCGLFSGRYAARFLRQGDETTAVHDCVAALKTFKWAAAQKDARGVTPTEATTTGRRSTVRLSSGTQLTLTKAGNRWVINDIQKA